jgi:hypothetical protein
LVKGAVATGRWAVIGAWVGLAGQVGLVGLAHEGKRILSFFTQFPINIEVKRNLGEILRSFRKI